MSQTQPTEGKVRFQLTAPATMTFPHFITAKSVVPNGKPKFSCNFELADGHPDIPAIKALIKKVVQEATPGVEMAAVHKPLADGTKLADKAKAKAAAEGKTNDDGTPRDPRAFSRGKQVLTARSDYRPKLGYIDGSGLVEITDENVLKARDNDTFYPGVQVVGTVSFVPYDVNGSIGVTAYLDEVVSFKKGDRIKGNARSLAESFKGYVGLVTAEDPTVESGDDSSGDDW